MARRSSRERFAGGKRSASKRDGGDSTPTMIIPSGTDIQVDVHGQLNIRTPGNLVIENSGHYGTLESINGSIRIESRADVEAVNVHCAGVCYVEGGLTAWKVVAESIHLEDQARANIVLQETGRLEIGKEARLVGNFGSEKELFLTFSRFAQQLRSLPLFAERGRTADGDGARDLEGASSPAEAALPAAEPPETGSRAEPVVAVAATERPAATPAGGRERRPDGELPDPLFFALILLEREFSRSAYGPTSQRVIEELIKLLQERDLETLSLTYKTLCGRVVEPGEDVRRAHDLIHDYFQRG